MNAMFLNPNANARPLFRGAAAIAPYNADGGHGGWGRKKRVRRGDTTTLPCILAPAALSNSNETQSTTPTAACQEQENTRATSGTQHTDDHEPVQTSSAPSIIDVSHLHQSQPITNEQSQSSYSHQPQPASVIEQSTRNTVYASLTGSSQRWDTQTSLGLNVGAAHDHFHEFMSAPLASSSTRDEPPSELLDSKLRLPVFQPVDTNSVNDDDRVETKLNSEDTTRSSSPSEYSIENFVEDNSYLCISDLMLPTSGSGAEYSKTMPTYCSDSYISSQYEYPSYADTDTILGHHHGPQHMTSYDSDSRQIWSSLAATDRKTDILHSDVSNKSNLDLLLPSLGWSNQQDMGNNRLLGHHPASIGTTPEPEQRRHGMNSVNYSHPASWPSNSSNDSGSDAMIDGSAEDYQRRGSLHDHDVKPRRNTLRKEVVGTLAIRQAGASRRKTAATFNCQLDNCDAAFTRKHNLKNHMETHQGTAGTHCERCGKELARSSLRRHEKKCIYPALTSQT